jgi:hypothetical protein
LKGIIKFLFYFTRRDGHPPDTALSYSTVHTHASTLILIHNTLQKILSTLKLLLHTQIVPSTLVFSVHTRIFRLWLADIRFPHTSRHKQPDFFFSKLKSTNGVARGDDKNSGSGII